MGTINRHLQFVIMSSVDYPILTNSNLVMRDLFSRAYYEDVATSRENLSLVALFTNFSSPLLVPLSSKQLGMELNHMLDSMVRVVKVLKSGPSWWIAFRNAICQGGTSSRNFVGVSADSLVGWSSFDNVGMSTRVVWIFRWKYFSLLGAFHFLPFFI